MATIILGGGLSTRMGLDKASLAAGGCTMIESLATRFAREIAPVIVVLRPGQELVTEHTTTVYDLHQGVGPLGGLHAGLLASPDETNFVIACDMPFADPDFACYILSQLAGHDAAVPMLARGPEPLHSAYRKSCLPAVESSIAAGRLRMRDALDRLDVLYIPENELKKRDPDMRSFVNVNTPEEYIGSVVGHLCSKRGKVLSIENKGNQQVIAAEAPLADMFGYVSTLRSLTSGRASYSMHFDKYIAVPFALVERIIEEKKEADKESKG